MLRQYWVGLEYAKIADFLVLATLFKKRQQRMKAFIPESIESFDSKIYAKTTDGKNVLFGSEGLEYGIVYHNVDELEDNNLLEGIQSAIEIAIMFETRKFKFDPNLVILYFEPFDKNYLVKHRGDAVRNLQKRLYHGGNPYVYSDYAIILGTDGIKERKDDVKVLEGLSEIKAESVKSLDHLLNRIRQH